MINAHIMPRSNRKPNSMLPIIRLTPKKPKAKPAATENINWSTAIIWLFIALTVIEKLNMYFINNFYNFIIFTHFDRLPCLQDSVGERHLHF